MKSPTLNNCYLALGSNLHSPVDQITRAYRLLCNETDIHHCSRSSSYKSKPMLLRSNEFQPDYVNAVMRLQTTLTPDVLLTVTQGIEKRMGRHNHSLRWSARIIDIDILSITGATSKSPALTLPHPGLMTRSFFLVPLAEIDPQFILPNYMKVSDYLRHIKDEWEVQLLVPKRESAVCN